MYISIYPRTYTWALKGSSILGPYVLHKYLDHSGLNSRLYLGVEVVRKLLVKPLGPIVESPQLRWHVPLRNVRGQSHSTCMHAPFLIIPATSCTTRESWNWLLALLVWGLRRLHLLKSAADSISQVIADTQGNAWCGARRTLLEYSSKQDGPSSHISYMHSLESTRKAVYGTSTSYVDRWTGWERLFKAHVA